MRYDRLIAALERAKDKYEAEVRRLIKEQSQEDQTAAAQILNRGARGASGSGKGASKKGKKLKAKGWTPERRAAQSRRIKAIMRAKRDAE